MAEREPGKDHSGRLHGLIQRGAGAIPLLPERAYWLGQTKDRLGWDFALTLAAVVLLAMASHAALARGWVALTLMAVPASALTLRAFARRRIAAGRSIGLLPLVPCAWAFLSAADDALRGDVPALLQIASIGLLMACVFLLRDFASLPARAARPPRS